MSYEEDLMDGLYEMADPPTGHELVETFESAGFTVTVTKTEQGYAGSRFTNYHPQCTCGDSCNYTVKGYASNWARKHVEKHAADARSFAGMHCQTTVVMTRAPHRGSNARWTWHCSKHGYGDIKDGKDWGFKSRAQAAADAHVKENEEITMRVGIVCAGMSKADRLRARRDEIEEELARLEAMPEEPEVVDEDDDPNVIWFIKRFGNGVDYTYAAVRASDGLWYTTGPSAPKGYSWDRLIEWILSDGDEDTEVWWGTDWALL